MKRRHERPLKRVNPSGQTVWVARYTDRHGRRKSAGTFELRGACRTPADDGTCCAQHAIDHAYDVDQAAPLRFDTVGAFAKNWTQRHPRSDRTNATYDHRVGRVLDIELEGRPFRDWPMGEVRRKHANDLKDHLLTVQKRAAVGATGILRALSAMFQDALDEEIVETNPFFKLTVKATDQRVSKAPKEIRVWSWAQMHALAAAAGAARTGLLEDETTLLDAWRPVYAEAMVRTLADCGLRLGELLPLERADLRGAGDCDELVRLDKRTVWCPFRVPHVHVRRTAHEGTVQAGTKTDHGESVPGRAVPLPEQLEGLLRGLPARLDTRLLFPTPTGRTWRESLFYRDVWGPAKTGAKIDPRPHEFRHSWISHLQAAGVDAADLAAMAGHTVLTMMGRYTHSMGASFDAARKAVGS